MALDFTAIDFETANGNAASACAVGLVKVRDGLIVDRWSTLIRPPAPYDEFWEWNIRIHGIRAIDVLDAPDWAEAQRRILEFGGDDVYVAHNAGFDKGVMRAAAKAARLPVPDMRWTDSLRIARKTYALESYRLPVAALAAGFDDFRHHDAAGDAEACAAIVIGASRRHECDDIDALVQRCVSAIHEIGERHEQVAELAAQRRAAQRERPWWQ
ncbi:3'-5' exonuclease [Agrococcus carbonis]|uniref:DNA polymerase-3 subunit epsilon n=1 Tax=Agrococcus carbonis TaxID=684552 RepID=A0A1H1RXT4_9MICO|nr:3'-5' exonuclease [Agrococcus carbonis]SDS40561.1 DNA polymerase-3 subunit epsilon [Agrococcus carbonis]